MTDATAISLKPNSGWAKTNPVWCLEQLKRQFANPLHPRQSRDRLAKWIEEATAEGVRFPEHVADKFSGVLPAGFDLPASKLAPRVVGLLVEKDYRTEKTTGFVNPLIVSPSSDGWFVSPDYLPFSEINVQDAIFRLLREVCGIKQVLPELRGLAITEALNEPPHGASMTIAALLAVIDALNSRSSDLFRCACVVVQPKRDALERVGSVGEKLSGFIREYGSGSLLVRHPECKDSREYDKFFPASGIWEVASFADLAEKLLAAKQLDAVLKPYPLTLANVADAKRMIRAFERQHKLDEAVAFAERLNHVSTTQTHTLLRVKQAIQTELEELNRHIGRYLSAIEHSANAVQELERLGELSSTQELLDANVRLSAALFDGHDFDQAIRVLKPFETRIENEPLLVTAESQFMFYNTMARAKVANAKDPEDEWKRLFEKSISLQERVDPNGVSRTKCYLIHGLLRSNSEESLDEARKLIDELFRPDLDSFTGKFLAFYRADYYRRCEATSESRYAQDDAVEKLDHGHPVGFYFQATARQLYRSTQDRISRFERAARVFDREVGRYAQMNILQLFAYFMKLASSMLRSDREHFKNCMQQIHKFLSSEGAEHIKRRYANDLPKDLNPDAIDRLLDRVPYF